MDKDIQAIEKLEKLIEDQRMEGFDDTEIQILKRVIVMVRGFDALGTFASFISRTIIWIGIVIGGIVALKTGFVEWVLSIINGGAK